MLALLQTGLLLKTSQRAIFSQKFLRAELSLKVMLVYAFHRMAIKTLPTPGEVLTVFRIVLRMETAKIRFPVFNFSVGKLTYR